MSVVKDVDCIVVNQADVVVVVVVIVVVVVVIVDVIGLLWHSNISRVLRS